MGLILIFLLVMFSSPAQAIEVTYSHQMCRLLAEYTPDKGVTYQPGVDVHGNAVAPADINGGGAFQLPEIIKIPLSVDLAQRFGLPDFTDGELSAQLGVLEITKDGRVLQDGRDLTAQAKVICRSDEESG
ncbi:MAG: hypothetical protein H6854_04890 [Rhodospirillales bacterium]|nr:hypothetical protein [Rhodospirillales bacterium]